LYFWRPSALIQWWWHGGGKAITRALETAGLKAEFAQGHRVTDAATVEIVDRVLSREVNPEIVHRDRGFWGEYARICRLGHFSDAGNCCVMMSILDSSATLPM